MPFHKGISNFQFQISNFKFQISNCEVFPRKSKLPIKYLKLQPGFNLLEILISLILFLIITVVTIFSTASGSFNFTRRTNYQSTAAKIASREIEDLRKADFASLTSSSSTSDPDFTKLPNGTFSRTVNNYGGSSDIFQVNVLVGWTEISGNAAKQAVLDTLIYKNGL